MYALLKVLLVFAVCAISLPVGAIDKITIKLEFTPNLEDGKQTFAVCARCHLPEAWGNGDGTYPQLAGQHVNVLMKQILDIRSGKRASPLMYPFVQQRTIGGYQSLTDVVAYISTLPMNPAHSKGPWSKATNDYKEGQQLYTQYCLSCHGATGEGNDTLLYPKLHGQHFHYMSRQLNRVKSKLRQVAPAMQAVIEQLSFEQLDKVVNYISYLPVPEADRANSTNWRNPDF